MSLKKLLLGLMILTLVLTTLAGCQESKLNAIELVPQGANLVANIQISKIVNDQDFRDIYRKIKKLPKQPQTFEEALNELVEETGIDLGDFSQAVVFTDLNTIEQAHYVGFITEGNFNEKQFIDNIEKAAGKEFSTSDYKGYKLYTGNEGEFVIAFLSEKMLLGGTIKAVKDIIDVSKGDRKPVSGQILDTYNRLGDTLVKVAFELPEEAKKALTKESASQSIPISFEPFADIDIIGFSINKSAETMTILINPHFLSTDSAQDAKDTVSGAISLFKGITKTPEIKELLGNMEVTVTDSWMTIALEITLSEIEQIINGISKQFLSS
jgi:hypothetical protein